MAVNFPNLGQQSVTQDDSAVLRSYETPTTGTSTLQSGPLPNPLDKYSSYAWNAALYICKPSDYNAYATGGNDGVPGLPGYQLIARSGGAPIGASQRNPFFSDIDLAIDRIKIDATIGFNMSGQPASSGDIDFSIIEPAGATFLYRLQSAVADLYNRDPSVGRAFYNNTTFAMIIKFYGYDSAGNVVTAKGTGATSIAGAGEDSAITKIFFFQVADIQTKIGARIVEYHVQGVYTPQFIARGAISGVSPARFELTGTNLNDIFNGQPGTQTTTAQDDTGREENGDADAQEGGFYGEGAKASAQPSQNIPTRGLAQALNDEFNRLSRPNKQGNKVYEFPDEYEIVFASEALKNAKITIADIDNSLKNAAGATPTDSKAENTRKNTSIAKDSKNFVILPGTPIIQWLDTMIRNSDYIKQQATALVSEASADADIQGEEDFYGNKINQPKSPIKWYKIIPIVQVKQYDNLRKNYAYKITYVIADYYITDPKSPYFKRAPWPGPDKIYYYTFTGQNTQVLSYEQSLNFLYRQTFSLNAPLGKDPARQAAEQAGRVDASYAFRVVAETGKQGSLGDSTDLAARAAAGIYSPTDFADLKLKVIGDPDYLFQDYFNITDAQLSREEAKRAARSNGLGTNYGELYLQMTFLTGADWNLDTGIADINPRSGYARRVSNAYRINRVVSHFTGGRFEQDIEGTLLTTVDPERQIVKGDYVVGGAAAGAGVVTDTTDTSSVTAREEYNAELDTNTGAFDQAGVNDLRIQEGGESTVPQSATGALPAPPPPQDNPLASRLQEQQSQRDQFRRGLLPNESQIGNDDAPPDNPFG